MASIDMHIRAGRAVACILGGLLAVSGCGSDDGGEAADDTTTSGPGIDLSTTDDGNANDDVNLDDSESGDDGPPVNLLKCTDVDFIFVVDNSLSMADEQQFLAQAVPGFVSAMQNALPDVETFQVGVVDTDGFPGLYGADPLGCDPDVAADCASCDNQLGAFLNKPQSATDPELSCNFSTGLSYMDGKSEDFANEFGCAALVGTEGNPIEQQAGALLAAVSPEMNGPGACNEGFVRDEALLVFLVISDEEDNYMSPPEPQGGSLGEPAEWAQAIIDAKDGKDTNVVALGLLGGSPKFSDCADLSSGVDGAEQTSRLVSMVDQFPTNFVGSVCSEGYAKFFQDALAKVSEGCANFIP